MPHRVVAALLRLAARDKADWEATIQDVLRVAAEILGVARASYWSLGETPRALRCVLGYVAPTQAYERGRLFLEEEAPRYFAALDQAGVIDVEDARGDERTADLGEYLEMHNIGALLDVPVWSSGELVGVLCNEHVGARRAWADKEVDFALAVGQVVATALEARSRSRAEAAEREATFLDYASRELPRNLDVQAVADFAIGLVVPTLGVAAMLDSLEDGTLRRVAVRHAVPAQAAAFAEVAHRHDPAADWQIGERAIRSGQALVTPDLRRDPVHEPDLPDDVRRAAATFGLHTALAVPLRVGEKVTGALTILRTQRQERGVLVTAEALAVRIAMAMENARLHERARDAVAARDEFIAVAAHELRGPLTALLLTAQALSQASHRSARLVATLGDSIAGQGQRLNRLIDHMLDATRLGASDLALELETVDLVALVREIVAAHELAIERTGSTVEVVAPPRLAIRASRVGLERVLVNILDNATKFGAGKPIALELRDEPGIAVFICRDRGIGIPPKILPRVFEPYVRGVSARSYGGLGLGLTIARSIAQAHGGDIDIVSQPGEGATVTLRLPKAGPPQGRAHGQR
jgi:signal transduction histidine kinase